jgi:membrane-bound serine protease (ClpP class)
MMDISLFPNRTTLRPGGFWLQALAALLCHSLLFMPARTMAVQPGAQEGAQGVAESAGEPPPQFTRKAWLVSVRLPVTESVASQVRQELVKISSEASATVDASQRPVLVLEFDTTSGATGQGSNLGSCLDLAMALTDPRMRGIQTVAFIPGLRMRGNDNAPNAAASRLNGHAVLVALSCNELAMHTDSLIGKAGLEIQGDGELEKSVYGNLVARRIALPSPVAMAMVDAAQGLYQVETDEGISFASRENLKALEDAGKAVSATTLCEPGNLAELDSKSLEEMQLLRHRVRSRSDLAARFKVSPDALDGHPSVSGKWVAAQMRPGIFIDSSDTDWSLKMLDNHLRRNPETNLLVVRLNSKGGDLGACTRLARAIADLDSTRIRTVAFLETSATGNASLVAMVCDQIVVADNATLGGPETTEQPETALEDNRPLIRSIARQLQQDWSPLTGLVDPLLQVARYRNRTTGEIRLLCDEELKELADVESWIKTGDVDLRGPLKPDEILELGFARSTAADFSQFRKSWQLDNEPVQLEPSPTVRWIDNLARWLGRPMIAFWLLAGAVFLLSTEMSTPGLGIPGFLGTLLLMLFFWSQYLGGNAEWLEILLFVIGGAFVLVEIFVLPGFGLFGIGGLLMIVVSIVLASQTFVLPRNSADWEQLPVSLSMVLGAFGGFFASVYFFGRHLRNVPFLRRLMLDPPGSDERISPDAREKMESIARREHLLGRTGRTTTPLVPAGKAQIGTELVDVITDGRMVEKGMAVRVVEVLGNRVMVEPVN